MSLKQFEILEMVAKGGMAEVYRARTTGLGGFEKEVCVKKILPHLTEDESFVEMFVNEAKLAATLNFGNIVQVHDLCVSGDGEYFIVMEYVHGLDLSDIIRKSQVRGESVPPNWAVHVCREICRGLHYAHERTDTSGTPLNVIHRDVSPHNVLVSSAGEVKITDFGIAKASSIATQTAVGVLKGKYGYMSPEQARGEPLDRRSDLFNLGIVLYELLVGERCFAGSSDFSTLNLMRSAEVTPPRKIQPGIPEALEKIVLKALAPKREDRFQDALEFERALADYAEGEGKSETPDAIGALVRTLMAAGDEGASGGDRATGVLALASVVGPAPEAEANAEPAAAKSAGDAPEKGPAAQEKPRKAPADKKPAAKDAAKKAAKAKADAAQPPADRKAEKQAAKEKAKAARKPVGRQHLKPGLTQVLASQKRARRFSLARLAVPLALAGAAGFGIGRYRAEKAVGAHSFRVMEQRADAPHRVIDVASTPPGAEIWLDGEKWPHPTPATIVQPADQTPKKIKLAKAGYDDWSQAITYQDQVARIDAALTGGPTATLKVAPQPPGVSVSIDRGPSAPTPLTKKLPPGAHRVELRDGRFLPWMKQVRLAAGATVVLRPTLLEKTSAAIITLETEAPSTVRADDQPATGPAHRHRIPVAPGQPIRLALDHGGEKRTIELTVPAPGPRQIYLDKESIR